MSDIGIAAADTFNGHIRTRDGQYHSFEGFDSEMVEDIKRRIRGKYVITLESEDNFTVLAPGETCWLKYWTTD